MEKLIQDVRYGIRMIFKQPAFTIIAVLALALGIGVNTAIFSIVNALLLNPLPFPELNRIVAIWEKIPTQGVERNETAIANYIDWKNQNQTFENIATYSWWNANLSDSDLPERVQGFLVTANLLDTLGVRPAMGRNFLPEEDQPGKDQVVILSYGLWQRRFAGDNDILNKTIMVNGITRSVIGVMSEDYNYPMGAEVLAPAAFTPQQLSNRGSHGNLTVARLKPGVSLAQAQADMDAIAAQLEQQYPQSNTGRGVAIYPLLEDTVRHYKAALLILSFAVGFVLLIACANVANLMLARAASRTKEMALRAALGASRWDLMRQLLMESVILSAIGGALGILLALWGVETLKAMMPGEAGQFIMGWKNVGINLPVLGYTLGLSLLVGIFFGLAPAVQASKPNLNETLKEGGGKHTAFGRQRLRNFLVISEVTLSILLLIGAGLAIKSFWQLLKSDPGFHPENVITMMMTLPRAKYAEPVQRAAFYQELTQRVENLAGVEKIGLVNNLTLGGSNSSDPFLIEGLPAPLPGQEISGRYRTCTPGYFEALGITLLNGRGFTEQDSANSQLVAVINETMARQHWPDGEALGKRFRLNGRIERNPWRVVVGIIKDVKHELYTPVTSEYYFPTAQDPWGTMVLVARTGVEPLALASAIRSEVSALDKDQPVFNIKSMEEVRSQSLLPFGFSGILLCVFGILALLLAAVGIYGVMSYTVTQRTHEIGIRMALGARQSDVLKMVIRHGLMLTMIGLGIGLIAAWFLTRAMASLLIGVSPNDLSTFIGISFLLAFVAFIACYIPARRATKVDPMVALRYE